MPIIVYGDKLGIDYSIPEDIDSRLPAYFYPALAGELFSIHGPHIFEAYDGTINLNTGTYGWHEALRAACEKLDMGWLMEYYDALPWYDSDLFDGIIEDRIGQMVKRDAAWGNEYYEHLLGKNVAVDNRRYNAEHSGE